MSKHREPQSQIGHSMTVTMFRHSSCALIRRIAPPAEAADTATAKPAEPADTTAVPAATADTAVSTKAAAAKPTGAAAAAAAVIDNINNAVPPVVFTLSAYTALYDKAKAKAKEEKEEGEEEEDKEVVEEEEDIGVRGKKDKDYLNSDIEIEDRQTTTSTTTKETAIGAITIVPIVVAVKGLIVYNRVIEEGLLEEAKKQYPIVRQPRRPGYRAKKPLPTLGHPAAITAAKLTIPA
ncbi:hypothetical protein P8C59_000187 [Phyllachora maydis]|uniref:Uncharacterized protein n=1 Tax=Phyllachora maydis TaxID=1825666 RepID=A0AAD9HVD9_9PEZI|nr:hypothetical protein P8C59_000187 [Phyllachora maydis]